MNRNALKHKSFIYPLIVLLNILLIQSTQTNASLKPILEINSSTAGNNFQKIVSFFVDDFIQEIVVLSESPLTLTFFNYQGQQLKQIHIFKNIIQPRFIVKCNDVLLLTYFNGFSEISKIGSEGHIEDFFASYPTPIYNLEKDETKSISFFPKSIDKLTCLNNENILILDKVSRKIIKFDLKGNPVAVIVDGRNYKNDRKSLNKKQSKNKKCEQDGIGSNPIILPANFAVDRFGKLFIIDEIQENIKIYNLSGEYIEDFEIKNNFEENINYSLDFLEIDKDNNIWLYNTKEGIISIFDSLGFFKYNENLTQILLLNHTNDILLKSSIKQISIDRFNNLFVLDSYSNILRVFNISL